MLQNDNGQKRNLKETTTTGTKVLSLFDGMSCGMIAMILAGIKVDRYVAYEIDKFAIQTSTHNFPMIEQCGDVFNADFTQYTDFDFLVGGSPCTHWSIAQTKNRETTASGIGWELFSQYVRALNEAKPKYFLYENNKSMSNEIRKSISETFGFEPILINSALVSAQNRQRLYWCGIRQEDGTYRKAEIAQPEDRGILLKDILETTGTTWLDKSHTIDANYFKGGNMTSPKKQSGQRNMVAEPIRVGTFPRQDGLMKRGQGYGIMSVEGKSQTVLANQGGIGRHAGLYAEPVKLMQYELDTVNDKDNGVIGMLDMKGQENIKRVYSDNGKAPTLTTCGGGHREPKVFTELPECFRVKEATKIGYTDIQVGDCVDMSMPNSKTRRGRNMKNKSNCLQTSCAFFQYCGTVKTPIYEVKDGMITIKGKAYPIKLVDGYYIIRKLTVRECMRLQTVPEWFGFPVSNSQAYKQLGNGWTCEVIKWLLENMLNN